MNYKYSLRIDCELQQRKAISDLIGLENNGNYNANWSHEIVESETDNPVDFISFFLSYLNDKDKELLKLGVKTENISIWMLYEYDGQCNLEFLPKDMKRLGEKGISLCVSCWESSLS